MDTFQYKPADECICDVCPIKDKCPKMEQIKKYFDKKGLKDDRTPKPDTPKPECPKCGEEMRAFGWSQWYCNYCGEFYRETKLGRGRYEMHMQS